MSYMNFDGSLFPGGLGNRIVEASSTWASWRDEDTVLVP
jgi:Fe-S cluster biosynthesis and repair protein YggX